MPAASDVSAARDLTLQKIGRNVVNFQKMEAMLKFILTVANFSVPISKVQVHLETQAKRLRSQSMGLLVESAAKILHSEAPAALPDIRGGAGFSDRGINGFLAGQYYRRNEVHEEAQTKPFTGIQGADCLGGDP